MTRNHPATRFKHTSFAVVFSILLTLPITLPALYSTPSGWAGENESSAFILEVKGAIGPGVSDFVRRGL